MSDLIVLYRVELGDRFKPTGRTHHTVGGIVDPPFSELRIVCYRGDGEYYLFYCDEDGEEITDTLHDSIELAMQQAKWEFNIEPTDWEKVDEEPL